MKIITGDLIQLALAGHFDVIVHGCNCMKTMGAGVAKAIKEAFPAAYKADQGTLMGSRAKLGTLSQAMIFQDNGHKLIVANAYTQFDWRGSGVKVEYEAMRAAFRTIAAEFPGQRIGYPRIGAGLAGGDWNIISKIIDEELVGMDHTLVEFGKTVPESA